LEPAKAELGLPGRVPTVDAGKARLPRRKPAHDANLGPERTNPMGKVNGVTDVREIRW